MTDFAKVLKTNPYHNADGTFGSKDSGGGGDGVHEHDKWNAEHRNREEALIAHAEAKAHLVAQGFKPGEEKPVKNSSALMTKFKHKDGSVAELTRHRDHTFSRNRTSLVVTPPKEKTPLSGGPVDLQAVQADRFFREQESGKTARKFDAIMKSGNPYHNADGTFGSKDSGGASSESGGSSGAASAGGNDAGQHSKNVPISEKKPTFTGGSADSRITHWDAEIQHTKWAGSFRASRLGAQVREHEEAARLHNRAQREYHETGRGGEFAEKARAASAAIQDRWDAKAKAMDEKLRGAVKKSAVSVLKNNPYHNADGTFGSKDSGGSHAVYSSQALQGEAMRRLAAGEDMVAVMRWLGEQNEKHRVIPPNVEVWHGTSEQAWESIRTEGLVPGKGGGGDVWASKHGWGTVQEMSWGNRKASVYFTTDRKTAELYAERAGEITGSKAVLLKVAIPQEEYRKAIRDEEDPAGRRIVGQLKPEWITLEGHVGKAEYVTRYLVLLVKDNKDAIKKADKRFVRDFVDFSENGDSQLMMDEKLRGAVKKSAVSVLKNNPYHNADGTFGSKDSGGSHADGLGDRPVSHAVDPNAPKEWVDARHHFSDRKEWEGAVKEKYPNAVIRDEGNSLTAYRDGTSTNQNDIGAWHRDQGRGNLLREDKLSGKAKKSAVAVLKNNPYRNHDGTFGSKDSSGAASQRAELKPTDGDFKGGVMREGSKPDNPHHGANKEMEAPLNLLKNGVHREGHTMAVVGSAKMPEGRYSVSFQPRAYNPRGRQHPVTVAGNFATAEDAVAYSRAYAKHHGTSTIDQATPFGDPKPDPGVKKDDLTLDGVPKKNPEQAPHKRKRIQGLDF